VLTIKNKFIITGVIAFISMIGMLTLSPYVINKVRIFNAVSIELSQVESSMLTLRRNEKDFLARNDLKYKEKFKNNFTHLIKKVELLEHAVAEVGIDVTSVKKMTFIFKEYNNAFLKLVAAQQKIGLNPKDGLYSILREAVHQVENEINILGDQKLRADMLQLRRNEKDFMLRRDIKYLTKFNKNIDDFSRHVADKIDFSNSKEKIQSLIKKYHFNFNELVKQNQNKGLSSNEGLLGSMRSKVQESENMLKNLSKKLNTTIEDDIGNVNSFLIIVNVIGAALAILILSMMVWLARGMLSPIKNLAKTMKQATDESDLSLRLTVTSQDEIGETSQAFNMMLERFQSIVSQVNAAASQISAASGKVTAITQHTSQGIQEQQSQTEQLATAMNEMSVSVQEVAKNTEEAVIGASQANEESNNGRQVVDITGKTINVLADGIKQASICIQRVEKDSENIGTVLDVIRGIADQTNLLALNAAIEAARAGEQGRGFAVVADEVRTLASRTQESTQEIQKIIESLQEGSKEAVQSMENSREQAHTSVEQISKAGESLIAIVKTVALIDDMNTQIANAVEKQAAVVDEIDSKVVVINQVAIESAAGANQTSDANTDLAQLAIQLQNLAGQFKY